jgi:hypothetical protein
MLVGDRAGAVPSEAYQYDLVYECFARDEEFQRYWKVPPKGFNRCSTEDSISQKNSYIRVVMDLDPGIKLYPTAYTPGFATVPRDISDADLMSTSRNTNMSQQRIPGLPEGYSVALDVYILKDAEILLKHQRAFRGRVDVAYRWLDKIVNPDSVAEELEGGELAIIEVPPMDNSVMPLPLAAGTGAEAPKQWAWHSMHPPSGGSSARSGNALALGSEGYPLRQLNPRAMQSLHEVMQPSAREALPLSCLNACPRGLATDSTLDDVGKNLQDFRKEIHTENSLINAFGDHVGLPARDTGSWGKEPDSGKLAREKAFVEETARLDRALDDLWARTVDSVVVPDETTI